MEMIPTEMDVFERYIAVFKATRLHVQKQQF